MKSDEKEIFLQFVKELYSMDFKILKKQKCNEWEEGFLYGSADAYLTIYKFIKEEL